MAYKCQTLNSITHMLSHWISYLASATLYRPACQVQSKRCCHGMQTTLRIRGHDDDVNAVTFLDNSSNLIASGSDDTLIKVTSPFCQATRQEVPLPSS